MLIVRCNESKAHDFETIAFSEGKKIVYEIWVPTEKAEGFETLKNTNITKVYLTKNARYANRIASGAEVKIMRLPPSDTSVD